MLGVLFKAAGGTASDWALISDADEIADASAVAELKRSDPLSTNGVLILGARHHFKYTIRCDETGTFTRGPIAVSGKVLHELGAQRARDGGRRSCLPVGHRGSCGRVSRKTRPASSWQFSNFGGLQNLKFKLQTNSFAARASMLDDDLVLKRESSCQDHLGRGHAFDFNRTSWDAVHLPQAPEVPQFVEHGLSNGHLQHFVDMSVHPLPLKLIDANDPNIWLVLPTQD